MSNLADRIYAVRLSIGQAAMEIENVDGADAGSIFDSMTDLDEIESDLRALLAERDALRDRIQQFADDCNNSKATFDGQYVANELNSILRNEVQK